VPEFAAKIGISLPAAYKLVKAQRVSSYHPPGGKLMIPVAEVDHVIRDSFRPRRP
jgi:hypothetical protein